MMFFDKTIWYYLGRYIDSLKDSQFDIADVDEIGYFKQAVNIRLKKDYLLDEKHLENIGESDLAARSNLLSLVYRNRLVATCRLTPPPFEISRIFPNGEAAIDEYSDYLEISRLICVQKNMSANFLIHVGTIGISSGCKGFVGLCMRHHLKSFKRFGFKIIAGPLPVPDRKGNEYFVVVGNFTNAGIRSCGYVLLTKFKMAFPNRQFWRTKKLFWFK